MQRIDITVLRHADELGMTDKLLGYFAYGHVDKQQFATAVNEEYWPIPSMELTADKVRWAYAVKTPLDSGDGWALYTWDQPKEKTFPVTIFQYDD